MVPAVTAGVIGGVPFGVLLQGIDLTPMVAMLVGSKSLAVGWLMHLAISALIGAGFGVVLWVLGALLIVPAKLGMTDMVFHVGRTQWQSPMGYLIYGLLLGLTFGLLPPVLARRVW